MRDRKLMNIELGRISAEEYRSKGRNGSVVVLDNVRSAFNVGSALRSSDAFRIDKVVLCGISATPPSAEIHKSALGAENSVPWAHYDSTLDALMDLRKEGFTLVAVEQTEGSVKLDNFLPEAGRKYAFIFGNEVDGVSQEAVDMADLSLEIPQYGTKHSLNVSVSVGVILWQFRSRRPL